MGEIIRNWLFRQTGILFDIHDYGFGKIISDGTVLAKLLQSYNVIQSDVAEEIKPSDNHVVILSNLYHIQQYLRQIGIHFGDTEVEELASGVGTTALKLLYKIFLTLEGDGKFKITSEKDEIECTISGVPYVLKHESSSPRLEQHPLGKQINENKEIIEWYQKRFEDITKLCKKAREEARDAYKKQMLHQDPCNADYTPLHEKMAARKKEIRDATSSLKDFSARHELNEKELCYQDLIRLKETAENAAIMTESKTKARELLNSIRQHSRLEAAGRAFRDRERQLIVTKLSDQLLEEYQNVFDKAILQKLLKQSQYEKQVATKLFQLRQEQKIIVENRIRRNKLILDRRQAEMTSDYLRKNAEYEINMDKIIMENRRKLELHRRLYEAKLKHKYEKHYSICQEITSSLIDMSVMYSMYRRYVEPEVPAHLWNEWKVSFLKGFPIFEGVDSLEIILNEEHVDLKDPMVIVEVERNEVLMNQAFEDYNNLSGPWSLDILNHDPLIFKENLEVLGFVIHRLLATKYPKQVPKLPALLPPAKIAAVVVGISGDQTIDALKIILNEKGIALVTLKNVLTYSLNAYYKEMLAKHDFDSSMVFDIATVMDDTARILNEGESNTAHKPELQKIAEPARSDEVLITMKDKATQTPRIVPYDDDTSYPSNKAALGKLLYEILIRGRQIPYQLLVDTMIEYLRENTSESGWVLINFPSTYEQAALIEEALSGQIFPRITETNNITKESCDNITTMHSEFSGNKLNIFRSYLLENPIKEPIPEPFKTYFTMYLKMKIRERDMNGLPDIIDGGVITPLQEFYKGQGIYYTIYYQTFDTETIKYLANMLTGDWQLSLNVSGEQLGSDREDSFDISNSSKIQENPFQKTRREKRAKSENKPDQLNTFQIPYIGNKHTSVQRKKFQFKETTNGNTKRNNIVLERELRGSDKSKAKSDDELNSYKNSGKTENSNDKSETLHNHGVIAKILDNQEHAGHTEITHRFVEIPIAQDIQVTLATTWENVEKSYIDTLKHLFSLMRVHRSSIAPYEKFVRESLSDFITRPDKKQLILSKFQSRFNEVDEDLRSLPDMKNELHCRVSELESMLLNMCDDRKKESEAERRKLADQGWVAKEMAALADVFVAAMQAEADRAVDTLQLLTDYYHASLLVPLQHPRLPKITLLRSADHANNGSKASSNDRFAGNDVSPLRRHPRGEHPGVAVSRWLLDTRADVGPPLNLGGAFTVVEVAAESAIKGLRETAQVIRDVMSKQRLEVTQKMNVDKTRRSRRGAGKQRDVQAVRDDEVTAALQLKNRVFEEWEEAVANEVGRACFRLNLLRRRSHEDLANLSTRMRTMFLDIHEQIAQRYVREVGAVEALCLVLRAAIEEESQIQQQLVLDGGQFLVRHDVLMFPTPPPTAAPPVDEPSATTAFRIDQLRRLVTTFRRMSPSGVMPGRTLAFVLEDLLAHGSQGDQPRLLPRRWEALRPRDVEALLARVYGPTAAYVDWRDFAVHALGLRPASQVELLRCRGRLRGLDRAREEALGWDDFNQVWFWFEEDFPADSPELQVRLRRIKELLFSMFEIRKDLTSYTDMLLAFCKDEEPKEGLAKALAVATGEIIRVHQPPGQGVAEERHPLHGRDGDAEDATLERSAEDGVMLGRGIVPDCDLERSEPGDIAAEDAVRTVLARAVPSEYRLAEALPLELVAAVLAATVLWGAKIPPLFGDGRTTLWDGLTAAYRDLGAIDNCVPPWDFFQHWFVSDLLVHVHKFKVVDLEAILEEVLAMHGAE